MSELIIRKANARDVRLISALSITTCYEAYFEFDPPHDLADYCFNFLSPEATETEFNDPSSTFLIAELGGNAVGFIKLRENKVVECLKGRNAIEVQRIYVLEKLKGRKIGQRLIEAGAAIGREKGYEVLWLGVWDKNVAAQKFYERIRMTNIGTTDFTDGKSDFVNFVYAREL
ncbi:MAG: GNAT family N-acetyltransferase [Acidobacteria bacterium]|nr:GNAT family N-acetyltransferase [Acidobacteriota bacterium]